MTRVIEIDDAHPRPDKVDEAARVLAQGGLLALATDTTWIVACDALDRAATTKLQSLRARMSGESKTDDRKPMSLMCPDLAAVGTFALVEQPVFRLLRRLLPGPYTVILPASRQVPRQLQSKRRAIGVRIPDHPVATAITEAAGVPLFVTTCHQPDGRLMGSSPDVQEFLGDTLDGIVESTPIAAEPSTVLDVTASYPVVLRAGKGAIDPEWDIDEHQGSR